MKTIKLLILVLLFATWAKAQDYWTRKADVPGNGRYTSTGFSIGSKGYMCLGIDDAGHYYSDLWEYDPALDTWTQKANFPGGARFYATGFSYGGKGYVGTGANTPGDYGWLWYRDFWQYDPGANAWVRKNDFPGHERYAMVSFVVGNKVYAGTGSYRRDRADDAHFMNDFWEYDPATDHWTQKTNVPEQGRAFAIGMGIDNKGYIGTGLYYYDTRLNDFWEYDPITETWTRKADLPAVPRYGALAFSMPHRGFIASGGYYGPLNDLWEYVAYANTWVQRASVPTPHVQGISFSVGARGYLGMGSNGATTLSDFWEYSAYKLTQHCPHDTTVIIEPGTCGATVHGIDPDVSVTPIDLIPTPHWKRIYNGHALDSGLGTVSGQPFLLGTTQVIYSVEEFPGEQCSFTVTVKDTIPPVVTCPSAQAFCYNSSENYSIPLFTAIDNCEIVNISYLIDGATSRSGMYADASGHFNEGVSTIHWTVTDLSGNTVTCQTKVTVNPRLDVTIPDVLGSLGARPNTIYLGYGFNFLTLYASASGGTPHYLINLIPYYDYQWTNGSTVRFSLVNYNSPGNYTNNVTVQDAVGCTATAQKVIKVIDVRCRINTWFGSTPGVMMCKSGKQKCVYPFTVWAHVIGGAQIGRCGSGFTQPFHVDPAHTTAGLVSTNATNGWLQKADLPAGGRYGAIGFGIGGKGYMGLGASGDDLYRDFWEYDPSTEVWTQKADFGGTARSLAVGFGMDNKGYAGTGFDADGFTRDFWQYDPSSNSWIQKADFGGGLRVYATGFSAGNKGYIGTGYDQDGNYTKDFWQYNATDNTWTRKADFAGTPRFMANSFSISNKGYLGMGMDTAQLNNDLWEYDPAANAWTRKADMPGSPRALAAGFAIGCRGYIGTGHDTTYTLLKDFWEYDPTGNTWMQKAELTGGPRLNAVGLNIAGKGYIAAGADLQGVKNDLWQYSPDCYMSASIPDVYAVNPGGDKNTIYIGYGPSSLTLTAHGICGNVIPGEDFTYAWSNGATTSITTVNPVIPGAHTYSVTVSDSYGCSTMAMITINVVDLRCGNKNDKVTICQVPPGNPADRETICISKNAVAAHLKNGSLLGECAPTLGQEIQHLGPIEKERTGITESGMEIYPNPNKGSFTLQLRNVETGLLTLQVADAGGRVVAEKRIAATLGDQLIQVNLGTLVTGIYWVKITGKSDVRIRKLIIQ